LFGDLDVLLTLQQYQLAVPNTLARYLSHGARIIFESITIPVSDIVDLCQNPLSLLRWDASSATLSQVSQEVGVYI
jgi:hypothetical protein